MVLGEAFYGFCWNLLGASFYFIVIMTLKRYIFPLNSIRSYFNGGLSFVVFSIVEGNVNIFCGITKRYVLIISLFSIKKKLFEQDVIFVNDLLFELDTTNSFTIVSNKISKINYLIWAGLRHSVPKHLKNSNCLRSEISLISTIDNKEFDILEKKSKDYYMLIKRIIAQCLPSYTISSIYSESPPYSHLGNTVTSLLRPRFLAAWQDGHTFSCKKKTLVNTVTR